MKEIAIPILGFIIPLNYTRIGDQVKKYIFLLTIILCLPLFIHPTTLLNRGNDLQEFFWPIYYYTKESIINYHQVPLWNNLFFAGTPLLPDPQTPFFYLPNLLFLFTNIDLGFLISIVLHIFFAGVGVYLIAKNEFKFKESTSLFISSLYIFSPKLAGFIEAGHFGLIASYAWLPWVLLLTLSLAKSPSIKKSIFLSISLSMLFFTHILVWGITIPFLILITLFINIKALKYLLFSFAICIGLTSIALLPQIEWSSQTTRFLLLSDRDVYPKWLNIQEFLKTIILANYNTFDTEKTITLGIGTTFLAVFGFLKLNIKFKLILTFTLFAIFIFTLNNVSPIYKILINLNPYVLLRVSTRVWFVTLFISIFLAGIGLDNIYKNHKKLSIILAILTLTEIFLISQNIINHPITPNKNFAPTEIYQYLSKDKTNFRVLCTTRCLSQKTSAEFGLHLAEGYGTLQQNNYFKYNQQIFQYYWNHYSLSLPPFEIYLYQNLQPYSESMAAYNIKYAVSPFPLTDKNLKLKTQIENYHIYENIVNKNPNYDVYTPNFIKTTDEIIPEVYNSGWKSSAKLSESPDSTIQIDNPNHNLISLSYFPDSFKVGIIITSVTIFVCLTILLKKSRS